MDKSPASVIREEIRSIAAYHVPDSSGMVKLDAMENPYGLPSDLAQEVGRLAEQACLNRYPDPTARAVKVRLRQAMQIPDAMDILLGNGSDELIQILALAVNKPGAVLLGVEPSFVMFRMIATFVGLRYVSVPLTADFGLDLPALQDAIRLHRPALTFLAYPNNPTGNLFDAVAVERVAELSPGLVVVDEAYHAFAGTSFLPQLVRHPNLLVMRTLSKLGLAGLRLGLLIGRTEWLTELDKLRLPYNINVLTQLVAEHVLSRGDLLEKQAASIRGERARMLGRLAAVHGIRPFPSDANFILFRVTNANSVFSTLKARGILIKNVSGSHPMLADCLRVTVGTPEENDRFLEVLRESLPRAA